MKKIQTDNPFLLMLGAELQVWTPGHCRWALKIHPNLLNSQGLLQGGVTATLLDVACGYSGFYHATNEPPPWTVTICLTTNYIRGVRSGVITAEGKKTGGGRSVFFAEARLRDDQGQLIATGSGSFRIFGNA